MQIWVILNMLQPMAMTIVPSLAVISASIASVTKGPTKPAKRAMLFIMVSCHFSGRLAYTGLPSRAPTMMATLLASVPNPETIVLTPEC